MAGFRDVSRLVKAAVSQDFAGAQGIASSLGYSTVGVFTRPGGISMIVFATSTGAAIVCIPGSNSMSDWFADVRCGIESNILSVKLGTSGLTTCAGFLNSLNYNIGFDTTSGLAWLQWFTTKIVNFNGVVNFIGHSLGGAHAQIFGVLVGKAAGTWPDTISPRQVRVKIITFGSARPWGESEATVYKNLSTTKYRRGQIDNYRTNCKYPYLPSLGRDVVPTLPVALNTVGDLKSTNIWLGLKSTLAVTAVDIYLPGSFKLMIPFMIHPFSNYADQKVTIFTQT